MENYGLYEVERKFFLLIKNPPPEKKVFIVHEKIDKTWEEISCQKFETIGNSYSYTFKKIYKLNL